jgi:hypothetical protein
VLRLYLAHHAGKSGASVMIKIAGDEKAVWKHLLNALDLDRADVGDRCDIAQPEKLSGTVADIRQDGRVRSFIMHLDAPGPGVLSVGTFKMGDTTNANLWLFFYGDDAEKRAAAAEARWQPWLEGALGAKT